MLARRIRVPPTLSTRLHGELPRAAEKGVSAGEETDPLASWPNSAERYLSPHPHAFQRRLAPACGTGARGLRECRARDAGGLFVFTVLYYTKKDTKKRDTLKEPQSLSLLARGKLQMMLHLAKTGGASLNIQTGRQKNAPITDGLFTWDATTDQYRDSWGVFVRRGLYHFLSPRVTG
ncbi:hypothetical protein SKAU_G00182900 [Synaphobranchus kaupii]|uniref:Uncharacterized protein n=1 Tax=Synaphobranchus kaupii TaxID=118154 RepID=A0A9Q1IW41_SYNKA|nr:hypothetical protein SKAU_G00182900 [Synaphobranchus kaupii]